MTVYFKGQAHLRRLYRAPDNPHEIIATCDKAYVPLLTYNPDTQAVTINAGENDENARRVELPFPAIDLAWCPFKKGDNNASFVTACREQPLQLWDLEDASLRASYVAANDSDYHVHAHAVCWFANASHSHWIAGGYGGFEDKTQVRVFDVMAEGSQPVWTYGAQRTHGLVSSLRDCAWPGTTPLLVAGYYNIPGVHLIDCRHRCPAAELHGLAHGTQALRVSDVDPFHVYAGGSRGDSRIACWDVRQPRLPLFTIAHSVSTNQVLGFDLLPSSSSSSLPGARRLVTSSTAGGVVVHSWKAGELPHEKDGVVYGSSIGPTSGLAVIDADTVVVTTGSRDYGYSKRNQLRSEYTGLRKTAAAGEKVASQIELEDDDDAPVFPLQKRARSPMTDDSEVEEGEDEVAANAAEATNVAVITFH